jgi:peptide/nickel transport system ATP-binding protein
VPDAAPPLLEVRNLDVTFRTENGLVHAVDGLSLSLALGEVVGIVGESGSGKTVSMLAVMRLIRDPNAVIKGEVIHAGRNLLELSQREMRGVRGGEIAMIFQDPMTALTPVYTVGWQIAEQLRAHQDLTRKQARTRTVELLAEVGISNPERRIDDYPHQFSGGMRQRVMIAMALMNNPDLLIADEPTTALDVTTQAQILTLIEKLQEEFGSAVIMITHDLGVVAEIADDVVVMYAAEVAEKGHVEQIFKKPHHPYTWGLMGSLPRLDTDVERLVQIQGQPPSLLRPPPGCRFHPRCPYVMPICKEVDPALAPVSDEPDHLQACHLDEETKNREAAKLLAGMMAGAS